MTNVTRYTAADLPNLMDKITRNSIGLDEYFDRLFNLHETTSNYPPYNLVQISNVESRLELALAGFAKKEVLVYTQDGKLFIEGQKEDKAGKAIIKKLEEKQFLKRVAVKEDERMKKVVLLEKALLAKDKIMVCGNLEFNHQVADWCKSQGMQEGSIREPGTFVVERAFVEK